MASYVEQGEGYVHTDDGNNDTQLREVECGGGGNCLFLSLAYLLRRNGIDNNVTYTQLRGYAAAIMGGWVNNFPVNLPHYLQPTALFAGKIGRAGVWGDDTCIQAVIQHYSATVHFEVHVLVEGSEGLVMIFKSPAAVPAHRLYLILRGFRHYRALVTDQQAQTVPASMLVKKGGAAKKSSKEKKKLSCSLKLNESDKKDTNTSNGEIKIKKLEIHHIDVGQGDCALILLRDANEAIVRSVLIDTGPSGKEMAAYFDDLIEAGDFRPIDVFIVSHYDSDHIGGARTLFAEEEVESHDKKLKVTTLKYVQPDIAMYDQGDLSGDKDYQAYITVLEELGRKKQRVTAGPGASILDFEGAKITCLAANMFMGGSSEGAVYSLQSEQDLTEATDIESEKLVTVDSNARSLALLAEYREFRYFTAGDLFGKWEEMVVEKIGGENHACVLKLGHHGASESTTEKTLMQLRPRCGVISCGSANTHGHPRQATIDRLEKLNETYPCDYYITADVDAERDTADGKFETAKLPSTKCWHNKQGSVVVTVTSKQAKNHEFTVTTDASSAAVLLQCGTRDFDEKYKLSVPKVKTERKRGKMTEQEKEEKRKRRRSRGDDIRLEVHSYLKRKVSEKFKNFDDLYYGEFGEYFRQQRDSLAKMGEAWEGSITIKPTVERIILWITENDWQPSGDSESDMEEEENPAMQDERGEGQEENTEMQAEETGEELDQVEIVPSASKKSKTGENDGEK